MGVRVVTDPRRGAVLHVVGSGGGSSPRRPARADRTSPVRQERGPSGPPRRDDDRRWESETRGWRDG
ncbi:hypothetical protein GA0070614_5607 [Micromonospora coxensis]|uniref:Uncharacterized protein n=1 Tax=Micromonospora coxensis TaxID=356852 RepID=A0A1C5JX01_9ACTN|nr:hypothetical protein GA0070614_5607 [Micromonospora coxensis]